MNKKTFIIGFGMGGLGLILIGLGCNKSGSTEKGTSLLMRGALSSQLGSSEITKKLDPVTPFEEGSLLACNSHPGAPLPWEGSGLCTRNNIVVLPLPTLGLSLISNSRVNWQFGYGISFALNADLRIYAFKDDASAKPFLVLGDGTAVALKRFNSSGKVPAYWLAADLSQLRIKISFPDENTLNGVLEDGTQLVFKKLASTIYGLDSSEDRFGRKTTFIRGSDGAIDEIVLPNEKKITFTQVDGNKGSQSKVFQTGSLVTEIRGPNNDTYILEYDKSGHLTKLSYPDETDYVLTYLNSQIVSLKTPDGVKLQFYYDSGFLSQIYNGSYLTSLSTPSRNVFKITQPGSTITEKYNNIGATLKQTEENGLFTYFNWKESSSKSGHYLLQSYKDHSGLLTQYTYSGQIPFPSRIEFPKLSRDDVVRGLTFIYDDDFKLTETNATNGNISTKTTYDPKFSVALTSNTNGKLTQYSHSNGLLTRILAPNGEVSFSAIYEGDKIKSETDENGLTTTYTYNRDERISQITDPYNRVSSIVYDSFGNPIQIENSEGRLTQSFDVMGRSIGSTTLRNLKTGAEVINTNHFDRYDSGVLQTVTSTYQVLGKMLSTRRTTYADSSPLRVSTDEWRGPRGVLVNLVGD